MKLQTEARNVVVSEGLATTRFNVKLDGKMFGMLSSKLYSDPIGAVIRELSTNAYDSQKDAGKGKEPFIVKLPNYMEPNFSVKDNGVGLSEEDIYKIYTTYGESNKTHTNELTGCLGLGSKSPFAYTDSFTVESRYNGVKTVYTCYVDGDQIPNIVKLSESKTKESNGFEVIIPVEKHDFNTFTNKATEILQWFPVKPKVVGGYGNFTLPVREYIYKTDDYGVHKHTNYYGNHSKVVMGSVAYALDVQKLGCDNVSAQIVNHGIDVFVNIGDVQFTPNREELIYDKATIASINAVLEKVKAEIVVEVKQKIDAAPTRWEARKIVAQMSHPVIGSVCNGNMDIKWKDQNVSSNWNLFEEIKDCQRRLSNRDKDPNPIKDSEIITLYRLSHESNSCKRTAVQSIPSNDNISVFLFDIPRGNLSRVWWFLENNRGKCAYAFEDTEKARQLLVEEGVPYTLTSTLSAQPKESKATGGDGKRTHLSKVNKFNPKAIGDYWEYWQGEKVDLEDGGVYVAISHYQYLLNYTVANDNKSNKQSPYELRDVLESLKELGGGVEVLYGLRPADIKSVESSDDWVSLLDYMKKLYEKHKKVMLPKIKALSSLTSTVSNFNKIVTARAEFAVGSPMNEYAQLYLEGMNCKDDKKVAAFRKIANIIDPQWDNESEEVFEKVIEKINKEYKLLGHSTYYYSSTSNEDLIEYIDAIDLMRKKKFPKSVTPGLIREEEEAVAA